MLNTRPLRRLWNTDSFVPGSFGGLADAIFISIDINYLRLARLLGFEIRPIFDHVPVPLGVAVSGYLICLPMTCAELEERERILQGIDELVSNTERCAPPTSWGLVVPE